MLSTLKSCILSISISFSVRHRHTRVDEGFSKSKFRHPYPNPPYSSPNLDRQEDQFRTRVHGS